MRNQNWASKLFESILGLLLVGSFVAFLGSIYYACEAYPSVVRSEMIDQDHGSITLKIGTLCDPPGKLLQEFQTANPKIEVEGYALDTEWGVRVMKIRFKRKT
jgi:hypothetical protein